MAYRSILAFVLSSVLLFSFSGMPRAQGLSDEGHTRLVNKNGFDIDLRSFGRIIADEVAEFGDVASTDPVSPEPGLAVVPQIQFRGGNVQVNDPALDNIQIFAGTRPYVKVTQSEVSIAAFGRNIVVGYNSSANQPVVQDGPNFVFTHRFLSGFSTSTDGGVTWMSGFVPPLPGSRFTFGDPVVAVDRHGNFFYATLGADASRKGTVQVNKSTDGGVTWAPPTIVQIDNGSDKEWMAVGPDPVRQDRDNVYVTWTSFQTASSQLRFARSVDGGATWVARTLFAPGTNPDPTKPTSFIQFSNPVVDHITGRLYVPFLHFSNADQDFIRILVSDDAGETFSFLDFGPFGASFDTTLLPITTAGELIDCGRNAGGLRVTIHSGSNLGGGRFGLRRFRNASRLTTQPAFAARNGVLYLAWSNSTSLVFGDPNAGSNILFMRSDDGGATWSAPIRVNPVVATNKHHVLPSLAIDHDPNDAHISFYTQHTNEMVDLDMANSHDRGESFPANRTLRVTSTSMALAPTNNPLPIPGNPFFTTNYDRTIRPCYNLGEYQGITAANGAVHEAWGDSRNTITEPVHPLNPLSGLTHPQQDVFFQKVKAQ